METPRNLPDSRDRSPRRAVRRPHLLVTAIVPLCIAACTSSDGSQVTSPSMVAMDDKIAPYYSDGEITIYQVQVPVHMPMREPTAVEAMALGKAPPFPHQPFAVVGDVHQEIRYTLTNLDTTKHVVELLVDPWNEFVRYHPGIQIISDEQTTPDLSGYDKFLTIEANSRLQGTITSDDTRELAVDLATVYNINANPPADPMANLNGLFNHAMNLQNRSTGNDPLIAPYIPSVLPAMIGFDLGLRIYADGPNSPAPNIAVEVQVDVTDVSSAGNKVVQPGSNDVPMKMPTTLLNVPKPPVEN